MEPGKLLLLSHKNIDGSAAEIPALAYLVLEEALIRLLDILGQVGIEHETGHTCIGYLGTVLYLDVLALHRWRRVRFDEREHFLVQASGRCAAW